MRYAVLLTLIALGCSAEPHMGARLESPPPAVGTASVDQAIVGPEAYLAESGEDVSPIEVGLQRKIIYTADIDLVVEQFDPIPDQVEALARQFDGFVASSDVAGSPGRPRNGRCR